MHNSLIQKFDQKGYKFLINKIRSESSKQNLIPVPGLFFTSSFPIVKWEFEHFEIPENKDGLLNKSHPQTLKGILSVLLDYWGQHLWIFVPQFYDQKKNSIHPEEEQKQLYDNYLQKSIKIMNSKFWTNENQPHNTVQADLTYGSYIEFFYGRDGALYERHDSTIGAGARHSKEI